MRLIDADKLRKQIHCDYSDDLGILEKIDEQPTAYDVNKVVERLEEEKHNISLQDEELEIRIEALDDAIDIIKAGGICENKFKQNYENDHINDDLKEDLEY